LSPHDCARRVQAAAAIWPDQGTTVLMVEQNVKSALKYSDNAIALEIGPLGVVQIGGRNFGRTRKWSVCSWVAPTPQQQLRQPLFEFREKPMTLTVTH
jgi:ABC-type nitrate/sulfonate/bicarbonate transport system ATPase subunit